MLPKKNQTILKVEALESRWMPAGLNPGQLLESVHDRPDGIVFVDKSLVDEVPAAEFGDDLVVAVDGQSDPVEQMGAVIRAGDGIRSVRIISHGSDGTIWLGGMAINLDYLFAKSGELSDWKSHLSEDADLLLYGCDIASTRHGQAFANYLAHLTQTDVSASVDRTGFGGNLVLEYSTGKVETSPVSTMNDWTENKLCLGILPAQRYASGTRTVNGTGVAFPSYNSFAALDQKGQITTWGKISGSPTGSNYTSITSSSYAFSALKEDGSIVSWGNPTDIVNTPTEKGFRQIFSGESAFAALKDDGTIRSWGVADRGGTGAPAGSGFTQLFSNRWAFAALKSDGSISAWGSAGNGGLGAPSGKGFIKVFSNMFAFAALRDDGTITAWGNASSGGSGGPAGSNFVNVFATRDGFCALRIDGSIVSWGNPKNGGSGTPSGAGFRDIFSTEYAFCAMKLDGSLVSWGEPFNGGLGTPTGTGFVNVFSTAQGFAALRSDGSIVDWGQKSYAVGYIPAPADKGYVNVITSGQAFTAVKSDGTLKSWGEASQCGAGAPSGNGYTKLYANAGAFSVIRNDGQVYSWGMPEFLGNGPGKGGFIAIQSAPINAPYFSPISSTSFSGQAGQKVDFNIYPVGLNLTASVLSGNLPKGLYLDPSTGLISGLISSAEKGDYQFKIGLSNGIGPNSEKNFIITVNQPATITSASKAILIVGTNGSFTLTASGFPTPTFTILSGKLPSGVALSAGGILSGIPAAGTGGTYTVTFKAANGVGTDATQTFTLTVNQSPTITSADKATFTTGAAGSFMVVATGYPAPTFSISSGTLPSGVTLSAGGLLSGTPADGTGGTYTITLKVANGVGIDATQAFTLTVNQAPAITSAGKVTFTAGTAGAFTVSSTGFPSPKFSLASGTLPAGVTLSSTGSLAGTPDEGTGGIWPIKIKATNGVGFDVTQSFTLTVNQAPAITSSGKTSFVVAQTGSFQITASGNPTPTFAKTSGVLPDGVTLSASGTLSGKPVAGSAGTYQFQLKASNGTTPDATQLFTLTVNLEGTINFTSQDRTSFVVGESGTFQVQADGLANPTYSLDSGNLPSGVTLSANGLLSGTPTAGTSGIHSFVIRATNGVNADATQVFTLTVNQVPAITSLDKTTFVTGEAGTFTAKATGFPAPIFSLVSGALPSGVSLSSSGVLSGTPAAGTGGSFKFTLKASNGVGSGVTQSFTLTVNQAAAITSDNKVTFTTGAAGSFTAVATGYPVPVFSVVSGTLPSGVTLSSGGVLSGTPPDDDGGTYLITIKAANGVGTDATQSFTLTVNQAPAITSANEATFRSGQTGSFNLVASGFPKPKFSILSGSLPSGVTMGADGRIQGTPDGGAGGVYSITMSASNGVAPDARQAFTLKVQESPVIFGRNSMSFRAGVNSSYWFTSFGFPAPVFTVQGTLPAGVTLSTNGLLAGTPPASAQGVYPITILASNGLAPDASKDLILTVTNAPTITSADTVVFRVGDGKSFQMTATGTPLPSFTKVGNLPQGISFASSGLLSGTPAAGTSGIYPLFVTASNGVNPDDTQGFTLVVQDAPVITSPNSTTFTLGQAGGFQLTAAGYPVPVYTVISGTLPAGISLTAGGLLSGTPAASTGGTYRFTVQATNGLGTDATQAFTLTVNQAPSFTSNLSTTFTTATAGSFQASASGYPSPVFDLASGILPSGVTLSAGGLLSGTPTAQSGGSYPVTLKASNGTSPDASQAFTLTVNQPPAITSGNSTTFTVGQAGIYDIVATGFPAPVFSITTGSLPSGVNLESGGVLSGTPASGTGGTYRFTVQAANGIGTTATQLFTLTVNQGLAITSPNATTFAVGQSGSFLVTGTGNPAPVFNITSGLLPAGFSFNSNGTLSGTPLTSTGGSYPLVIRASNSIGGEVTQPFTLTVNQAPVITSVSKASFLVGKSTSYSLAATGYPAPFFSLDSGSLPAGVGLMADGKLQGVALPGSKGSYSFTVKASNAGGSTLQNYTVAVSQEGVFAVAAMGGGRDFSKLAIYSNGTEKLLREVIPFPGFKGEFYVSSGDITGDGIEDIAVGSGQGSQNGHVVVFDGAVLLNPNLGKAVELPYKLGGSVRASLYAFVGYSSGVAVRLADMNDDGFDDMVLAPGTGAGTSTPAHLRVWNGKDCMTDFEAGKPLPYDYRWEMASFWAFGEGSNPGGGMALSVIRQAGPDLIIASQLFRGGSKVFRYDGQKVLTTVVDLTGWQDLSLTGNTVVGFDREGNRFFANGGTDKSSPDTVFVRDKDKKAAYTIDKIFGGTPGGLRLGLANMDADAEDELLVIRGTDSTTKVYDLFADRAVLFDSLKPGGNSGWV